MACYSFSEAMQLNKDGISRVRPKTRELIQAALHSLNIGSQHGRVIAAVEHGRALFRVWYSAPHAVAVPFETHDNVLILREEVGSQAGKRIGRDYSKSKPGFLSDRSVKDFDFIIWYWPKADHVLILDASIALATFTLLAPTFPTHDNVTPAGNATTYDRGSLGIAFNWDNPEMPIDVRNTITRANLRNVTEYVLIPLAVVRAVPGLIIAEN